MDETITNKAPNNVLEVGISFQIKYPNIIAKTNPRYFKGETKLTSEYLYCLLYTSPSPRDRSLSRMPSSA